MRRAAGALRPLQRALHAFPRPLPLSNSSIPPISTPSPPTQELPPAPTGALLVELNALLARYPVLSTDNQHVWARRLDSALDDLATPRRARIAVVGDGESGASAFVTAAFDDPLARDGEISLALASRRIAKDVPDLITLSYSDRTERTPNSVGIPSNWLREHSTDILELIHSDLPPSQLSLDTIYASDLTIFFLDELRLLSPPALQSLLSEFSTKPNLYLVLDSTDPSHLSTLRNLHRELDALSLHSPTTTSNLTLAIISTTKAMDALDALAPSDPTRTASFDDFAEGYAASGVNALKDQLAQSVASLRSPEGTTSSLQLTTASYVLSRAIDTAGFSGAKVLDSLRDGRGEIATLDLEVREAERKALVDLGVMDGRMELPTEELESIRTDLEKLFEGELRWWKLPLRSDDINVEIAEVMERSFLWGFERELMFNAGRLIGLHSKMTERTKEMFNTAPFSPNRPPLASLHSSILLNDLAKASTEVSCVIDPTELTAPLLARRLQITAPGGPGEKLQARIQKLLVSTGTLTTTSIAGAVFSELLSVGDLIGFGLFGTVLSAWLLQRGWGKAKKKFLNDVEKRVVTGLQVDLANAAQLIIDRSLYSTRFAVSKSSQLLARKSIEYDSFAAELLKIARRSTTKGAGTP